MASPSHIFPKPQVVGAKTVDRAIGHLDIDLAADHGHPTAARRRMKFPEFRLFVDLQGTISAGLQRLYDGVVFFKGQCPGQ